mmetsp:Transcript_65218/g.149570  ORF Transcript_65218/g.149570 Transcript_65218/m.149570 type:complete len:121 (-) Transcript_65218:13-375(-)
MMINKKAVLRSDDKYTTTDLVMFFIFFITPPFSPVYISWPFPSLRYQDLEVVPTLSSSLLYQCVAPLLHLLRPHFVGASPDDQSLKKKKHSPFLLLLLFFLLQADIDGKKKFQFRTQLLT